MRIFVAVVLGLVASWFIFYGTSVLTAHITMEHERQPIKRSKEVAVLYLVLGVCTVVLIAVAGAVR